MRPWATVFLALIWILLWGNFSWANVFAGLAVALVVQLVFPFPPVATGVRLRPWGLLVLVGVFLRDLVVASVWVGWLAMRPRPIDEGAVIEVQLRHRQDLQRVLVAELTALVPGTCVIDVDPATSIMTLHVLHHTDPAALDAERAKVRTLEDRVAAALGGDLVASSPRRQETSR